MLIPWRITRRNALLFIREIVEFEGIAFVFFQQSNNGSPEKRFSGEMRQEIIQRVELDMDDEDHIWLASDKHGIVYSFLHAQVLSSQEVQVDLLCSVKWGYDWQSMLYEGFGELALLFMLLDQRGIKYCHLPLALNMNYVGLAGLGWVEQGQGMYCKK